MIHQDGIILGIAALILDSCLIGEAKGGGAKAKERRKVERRPKSPLINIETSQRHRKRGTKTTKMVKRTLNRILHLELNRKLEGEITAITNSHWKIR